MKSIKQLIGKTLATVILALALAPAIFAQTNLQFTGIVQTDEQAIQLTWSSVSNEVYQVQCANALATNADGSTAWQTLYDDYPSQGTNTFWLDTGNYNLAAQILHPKYEPMRFYQIVNEGVDTTSDEPSVFITAPTNGSTVSSELTITVTAFTDQPVLAGIKLYVDGQEMPMADSVTNYAVGSTNFETATYNINTCEWYNGTHILFATTECESGFGDVVNSGPIATGHGVSPFVSVVFNNLVEAISFSQPSFNPSAGQTQQVNAVFAENSDWTLTIEDAFSNVVLTTTGNGSFMSYNWDGTGTGETNLPNGIYYYYITAETNGSSDSIMSGGSGESGGGSVPSPEFASSLSRSESEPMQLWAQPSDGSGIAVPFIIYPPGFDTNDLTIFEAPVTWGLAPSAFVSRTASFSAMDSEDGASAAFSGASSQSAPPTPQRPPNNPVKGLAGTFGVAYDTYSANGTNPVYAAILSDGSGAGTHISMQGNSASTALPYSPLLQYKSEANYFVSQMQHWGWQNPFLEADNQLQISQLRGSGTPFNSVSLGVLLSHGVYGTSIDYTANECKQMYYPITSGGSAQYLRLSEMNLGGSGTNGLKWMAIHACRSLYHVNWNSMKSAGVKPYNSNLHLLLGCDTDSYTSSSFMWYWAKYMNYGTSTNAGSSSPLTIRAAWYQAAKDAFRNVAFPSGTTINFVVAGDSACANDTLQTNSTPGGSWFIDTPVQVFP